MITLYCIHPKGFNVGNDAIHLALRHLIDVAFGRLVNVVSLPATNRYESQAQAGLTARTIWEINRYGHGVIVGGGNLYENGELQVDLDALAKLEVPLLLYSLSWGRVRNRHDRLVPRTDAMPDRIIRALNERAIASLARDESTLGHLHTLGCTDAQLGGCPTVLLDEALEGLPPVPEPERRVALVSIREPALMNIPPHRQRRVHRQVEAIVQVLRDRGHEPRLLCHDHRDLPFAASFPDVAFHHTGDVHRYLALLRTCRLSVSFRLHATLPCLAFGRPVVNVSYDERAGSAMRTMGFGDWDVDLVAEADPVAAIEERLDRLEELPARRAAALPAWERFRATNLAALGLLAERILALDAPL